MAKCEECEGRGTILDQLCPAHDYGDPGYPPAECGFCERKPCPACHGTGEREPTADEAAEYIWGNGYTWRPIRTDNGIFIICEWPAYPLLNLGVFGDNNLTAALRAAARAVYERGKE